MTLIFVDAWKDEIGKERWESIQLGLRIGVQFPVHKMLRLDQLPRLVGWDVPRYDLFSPDCPFLGFLFSGGQMVDFGGDLRRRKDVSRPDGRRIPVNAEFGYSLELEGSIIERWGELWIHPEVPFRHACRRMRALLKTPP